jgi:signal peptidase I
VEYWEPQPRLATAPEVADDVAPDEHQSKRLFREVVETLLLTVIIFLAVNAATGRFRIEGTSMVPTLADGQYVIVTKINYLFGKPARGDIIVFIPPQDKHRDFIKRVIGLPGDHVEIKNGLVFVNGIQLNEPYISSPGMYSDDKVLGPDQYYVLGDNRPNSSDSHSWGVLPEENIIGKAWISYWPLERIGLVPHASYAASP